jgi:hypothetical protein
MLTNRHKFLSAAATAAFAETSIVKAATPPSRSLLAAYHFGNCHVDPRNEAIPDNLCGLGYSSAKDSIHHPMEK